MIRIIKLFLYILSFLSAGLTLLCNQDYNPFEDQGNTRLHVIKSSFPENDTIKIFSTESISVIITVPKFAESFNVIANGNRLFENCTSVVYSSDSNVFDAGPYVIPFSFIDTGRTIITLKLKMRSGEELFTEISCYVKTPLVDTKITGNYQAANLETGAVADSDVVYQWKFDNNKKVEYRKNVKKNVTIPVIAESGKGFVKITDGYKESQPVPFVYSFLDTFPPQIRLIDSSILRGDTILCGSRNFSIAMFVTDIGLGIDKKGTINDKDVLINDSLLYKEFHHEIDSIVVIVKDKKLPQSNVKILRYFVKIDTSIAKKGNCQFLILAPFDSSISKDTEKEICGIARFFGGKDTLNHSVAVKVNGKKQEPMPLIGGTRNDWTIKITLTDSINRITAYFLESSGNIIDSIDRIVFLDSSLVDTNPPIIVDFVVDSSRIGINPDFIIVSSETATLRIIAYDEATQVKKVMVGDMEFKTVNNSFYVWDGHVKLTGKENDFIISVIDSQKNTKVTSIKIVKNNPPFYNNSLQKNVKIIAGGQFFDTMVVSDMDKDPISFECTDKNGVKIDKNGFIEFNPIITDTPGFKIEFQASDGFETVTSSVIVSVVTDSNAAKPVVFQTNESEFPEYIHAESTFKIQLKLKANTGGDIVQYFVKSSINSEKQYLNGDTLIIKPDSTDTGYIQLTLIVCDEFGTSDTIFPVIHFIPRNLPPKILPDSSLYIGDSIQIKASVSDSVLNFPITIFDPESTYVASPSVWLTSSASNTVISQLTGRLYVLKVLPQLSNISIDTIKIWCKDRGGLTDSLIIPIYYNTETELKIISPMSDTVLVNDTVKFIWNETKIPNKPYILEYKYHTDTVFYQEKLADTSTIKVLNKLGLYLWRVYIDNGKDNSYVPYYSFTLKASNHIAFKTTVKEICEIRYADYDTFFVKLDIVENTAIGKVEYYASLKNGTVEKELQVTDSGTVSWIPLVRDIGEYQVYFIACDSKGNCDTICSKLTILPIPKTSIDLVCPDLEYNVINLPYGLFRTVMKVQVKKIDTSPYDTFNIRIISSHFSSDLDVDSVEVMLKRPGMELPPDDSICIELRLKNRSIIERKNIAIKYSNYQKLVIINTTGISGIGSDDTIVNMPVLIRLDTINFRMGSKIPGFEFKKEKYSKELPYQINSWDWSSKTAEIWVLNDLIKGNSIDTIIMKYGSLLPDKSNGKGVFDTINGFRGVWHLEERYSGGTPFPVTDASNNNNSGQAYINNSENGKCIGSSMCFKKTSNEHIKLKDSLDYNSKVREISIEAWVKGDQSENTINGDVFSIRINSELDFKLGINSGIPGVFITYNDPAKTGYKAESENVLFHQWNYIVGSLRQIGSTITLKLFLNGDVTSLSKIVEDKEWFIDKSAIGTKFDLMQEFFSGNMDEVRVTSVFREGNKFHNFCCENQKPGSVVVQVKD